MKWHFFQFKLIALCLASVIGFLGQAGLQAQEAEGTVSVGAESSAEAVSDQEKIKRVEDSLRLSRALDEAQKIARGGDFIRAQTRLEDIINKTSSTGPYSEFYYRAYEQLAELFAIRAAGAERNGDWTAARGFWEEAVKFAPNNNTYARKLDEAIVQARTVEEQFPESQVADEALFNQVTEIQKLIYEGDSFYRTGQYPLAISRYEDVLDIDPYNRVARKRIQRVEERRKIVYEERRRALKEERMREVEERWSTQIVGRSQAPSITTTQNGQESQIGNIFTKLENIIIPSLNFKDINIVDAIDFLREQSVALDPSGEGVNIVLKTSTTAGLQDDELADDVLTDTDDITFSLNVVNQPLITILDFIRDLTPLKYEVEDFAVFIFPKNETSQELLVRTYSVPPAFFTVTPTVTEETSAIGGTSVAFVTADVKDQLAQKGVQFPSGASASYLPKTAKMVVKNTLDQLNLIDQLLNEVSDQATQIEIETKYVEFTEDKLNDFSFNWRVAGSGELPPEIANIVGSTAGQIVPFLPPFNQDGDPNADPAVPADGFPDFPESAGAGAVGAGTSLRNSQDFRGDSIDGLLNVNEPRIPAVLGLSAVLDGNGARLLVTALESALGADLLSAPKVTVVNNEQTKIRIAREFLYPTDFEPPEIADNGEGDGGGGGGGGDDDVDFSFPPLVIPTTPEDFEPRDIGVVLDIRANATPDRRIELDIDSDVTEFQGFINYAEDPSFVELVDIDGDGDFEGVPANFFDLLLGLNSAPERFAGPVADGFAVMPVFSIRQVETKVQVIDGQTVVLGGFIRDDYEEIEDKVPILGDIPLLGRMFRSKAERSIKRNLMIFITARMINPDGTPKFLTTQEAEEFGFAVEE